MDNHCLLEFDTYYCQAQLEFVEECQPGWQL